MPGRIAAQAIETVTASGGIPIGTALLVAALTLILFGLAKGRPLNITGRGEGCIPSTPG